MPFSDADGKAWALEQYQGARPATVVDIGPGCGTYADLMRPHHRAIWTGVEAWGPYVAEYDLATKYDRVVVADARWVNPNVFSVGLVILGDVLEHMTGVEALALIDSIRSRAASMLISVPLVHLDQDAWAGNPFETHVDHWTFADMDAALGHPELSYEGPTLGCWWWTR